MYTDGLLSCRLIVSNVVWFVAVFDNVYTKKKENRWWRCPGVAKNCFFELGDLVAEVFTLLLYQDWLVYSPIYNLK